MGTSPAAAVLASRARRRWSTRAATSARVVLLADGVLGNLGVQGGVRISGCVQGGFHEGRDAGRDAGRQTPTIFLACPLRTFRTCKRGRVAPLGGLLKILQLLKAGVRGTAHSTVPHLRATRTTQDHRESAPAPLASKSKGDSPRPAHRAYWDCLIVGGTRMNWGAQDATRVHLLSAHRVVPNLGGKLSCHGWPPRPESVANFYRAHEEANAYQKPQTRRPGGSP